MKSSPLISTKEKMIQIILEQPDDSTFEEIIRELAFAQMIDRGLADSDSERTISNAEMKRRIRSLSNCLPQNN